MNRRASKSGQPDYSHRRCRRAADKSGKDISNNHSQNPQLPVAQQWRVPKLNQSDTRMTSSLRPCNLTNRKLNRVLQHFVLPFSSAGSYCLISYSIPSFTNECKTPSMPRSRPATFSSGLSRQAAPTGRQSNRRKTECQDGGNRPFSEGPRGHASPRFH